MTEARRRGPTTVVWALVQLVAYVALIVPFGIYNVASVVAGWAARRRRAPAAGALNVVVPYPPGEKSGASKAIQNFLAILEQDFTLTVVPLYELAPSGPGWRRWLSEYLTAALPMPVHCRPFLLSPSVVMRRLEPGRTVVIEFVSGAMFLFFRRLPHRVVLRDHEVLVRRLASERDAQTGLTRLVTTARMAVCWLMCAVIYRKADTIVTLTPDDAAYLEAAFPGTAGKVRFVPQPLDLPARTGQGVQPSDGRQLLFLANFFHRPNVDGLLWFLEACAPKLPPGYTLHLVGLDEPIRELRLSAPGLTIVRHGFVENLDAVLPQVRIAVAPVRTGGGVRMKNLYLAAQRRAIVTTPLGNQGIGFTPGQEAIVTGSGEDMAREIATLANDPARVTDLGERAFARVAREFSPAIVRSRVRDEILAAEYHGPGLARLPGHSTERSS